MRNIFITILLLVSQIAMADAPVIWSGSTVKWLPAALQSAGVCKLDASGVMTSSTVSDSELATSYLKADGTRALSGAWNAGQNITAPSFIGALTGNADTATTAATATALASNPSDCGAGTKATAIDASGNLTCSAASLTADVSGILPMANGGTNKNMTASAGAVVYSDSDSQELSAVGTIGQALISGGTSSPSWYAPTAGSVLFAGTSGILSEDNSYLFWDATNHRLGIGTNAPSYRVQFMAGADNYSHGFAIGHALGNANALYRHYVDYSTNVYSICNPNQTTCSFATDHLGRIQLAGGAYAAGGAVNIANQTGRTSDHTLQLKGIGSQTGKLLEFQNSSGTTVAGVTIAGAGTFAGMTVSTLGAGVAQLDSSGVMSSTAPGTSGNVLTSNGSAWVSSAPAAAVSALSVAAKTADYTMTNSDDVILCNPTTGSVVTITMHSSVSATTKSYRVKNVGFGDCNVNTNGTDKFDRVTGETSASIPAGGLPTSGFSLIPDSGGSSWLIF
jgi:hypothetical protein